MAGFFGLESLFGNTVCCDCRKDKDLPRAGYPGSRLYHQKRVGLGITFREDFNGKLHIYSLVDYGAGHKCGALKVGDILIAIDGIEVEGMNSENLASLCLGLEGTEVIATFQRPPEMKEFKVTLVRIDPVSPD